MRGREFRRALWVAGLIVGAWVFSVGGVAQGQTIIRPPRPRAAAPKPVRPGSVVLIPIGPARPIVTYGPSRFQGYSAANSLGSAAYGPYETSTSWGRRYYTPTDIGIGQTAPDVLYGTYGFPSYGYNNQGGALGDVGILAPGLTIGVSNLGFGPWTYVGPVY